MINQFNSSIARTNAIIDDGQVQIIVSEMVVKVFFVMNKVSRCFLTPKCLSQETKFCFTYEPE